MTGYLDFRVSSDEVSLPRLGNSFLVLVQASLGWPSEQVGTPHGVQDISDSARASKVWVVVCSIPRRAMASKIHQAQISFPGLMVALLDGY